MIGVQIHGTCNITRFHAPNNRENVRANIEEYFGTIHDSAYTTPNLKKIDFNMLGNVPSNITINWGTPPPTVNWGTPPTVSCTVTIQSPEANVIEHLPTRYFS